MPCGCSPRGGPEFCPDSEGPSAEDLARFGRETIDCPACGAEVYDEAPFCHSCGHALGESTRSGGPSPIVLGVVIAVVAALALWGFL